jgi:hypothetical protein
VRIRINSAVIVGFIACVITWYYTHGRSTPYNNYALFANAILHGRLWIDWPGAYIDAVLWNGQRYIVNDPLPGFLMIPLVALRGVSANQTWLSIVLCGVGVGAAWELCKRLGASVETSVWLCIFFLFGTDLLWCSMLGDVWFIAQTCCVAMLTLALVELAGKNRAWVVCLYFVLAVASRFTVVMALPVVLYLIARGGLGAAQPFPRGAELWRLLRKCAYVLVPFAILWMSYNYARWGVPWDSGHTIFYHQDASAGGYGSPFSIEHVPYQLWSFFVQYPQFVRVYPWIIPSISGVALTWTEPALVLALVPLVVPGWRRLSVALWAAVILAAGPSLLYYVNGFSQYGMRHALDFTPFLFTLMILATRERLAWWGKALLAYSTLAGLYGVWFWNVFVRQTN